MSDESDNNSQRKSSEIILSLEQKVNVLTKMIYNYEFTSKLILQRLDNLTKQLVPLINHNDIATVVSDISNVPNIHLTEPSQNLEDAKDKQIGVRRGSRTESLPTSKKTSSVAKPPGKIKIGDGVITNDTKKVPVHQLVLDPNGKMIMLADVEVVTADRTLALKTRTNASGKWQGGLSPGVYTVSILKRETNARKRLEYIKEILIEESDVPIELEAAKLV